MNKLIITVKEAIAKGLIKPEDIAVPPEEYEGYAVADIDMTPVARVLDALSDLSYNDAEWALDRVSAIIARLKGREKVSLDEEATREAVSRELCSLSGLPLAR